MAMLRAILLAALCGTVSAFAGGLKDVLPSAPKPSAPKPSAPKRDRTAGDNLRTTDDYESGSGDLYLEEGESLNVAFDFYDRCENYNLESCDDPVAQGTGSAYSGPYLGMTAIEGVWFFQDSVVYEKDADTMKMTIAYGHDGLQATRSRVIMMSTDESEYLEYEEITSEVDDVVYMAGCISSAPKDIDDTFEASAVAYDIATVSSRRRILSERAKASLPGDNQLHPAAKKFHGHIRKHLAGFGNVHLDMPFHPHLNNKLNPGRRNLLDDDTYTYAYLDEDDDDDGSVLFESAVTDEDTQGYAEGTDEASLVAMDLTADEASELLAAYPDGIQLRGETDADDQLISTSLIRNPEVVVNDFTITWPDVNDCVSLDSVLGFEDGITTRANLDTEAYITTAGTTTSAAAAAAAAEEAAAAFSLSSVNEISFSLSDAGVDDCEDDCCTISWAEKRELDEMDDTTWTDNHYSQEPASAECQTLKTEVLDLYDTFKSLVVDDDGPMGTLDSYATTVLNAVEQAEDFEDTLEDMNDSIDNIELILKVLSPMPYVGAVLKVMGTALKTVQAASFTPAEKYIKVFNSKIQSAGIEDAACAVSKANNNLASDIFNLTQEYDKGVSAFLHVDETCTNDAVSAICEPWGQLHAVVNNAVEDFQEEVEDVSAALQVPADVLEELTSLLENDGYKAFVTVMDTISDLLQPLTDLLDTELTISIPSVETESKRVCTTFQYPCGVKYCKKKWKMFGRKFKTKYPCGTETCSKTVCATIYYPVVKMTGYTFSIGDVISGAMSAIDLVMDFFMDAITTMISKIVDLDDFAIDIDFGLPDFDVDLPDIPDFPSLPFDMPNPTLDLAGIVSIESESECEVNHPECAADFSSCSASISCSVSGTMDTSHELSVSASGRRLASASSSTAAHKVRELLTDAEDYEYVGVGYGRKTSSKWYCWLNALDVGVTDCQATCDATHDCFAYTTDPAATDGYYCYLYLVENCEAPSDAFIAEGTSLGDWNDETKVKLGSGEPAGSALYKKSTATVDLAAIQDMFDGLLEAIEEEYAEETAAYAEEATGTAFVSATTTVTAEPNVELTLDGEVGFDGTFTFPVTFNTELTMGVDVAADSTMSISTDLMDAVVLSKTIPLGPLPLHLFFKMQPTLEGTVVAQLTTSFSVTLSIECTTEISLAVGASATSEYLEVGEVECDKNIDKDYDESKWGVSAEIAAQLILSVNMDLSVNDIGMSSNLQFSVKAGADADGFYKEWSFDVSGEMEAPDWVEAAISGDSPCVVAFEQFQTSTDVECNMIFTDDFVADICGGVDEAMSFEYPGLSYEENLYSAGNMPDDFM